MKEPIIHCPNCHNEILLSESLAAPLLAATSKRYEEQLAAKEAQIGQRLKEERERIAVEEGKRAREAAADDLAEQARNLRETRELLKNREEKLAAAQTEQAIMLKKQRQLDDERREIELTIEKRVKQNLDDIRQRVRIEAEESSQLKLLEKEQMIKSMQQTIEELKRKSEQGSQQLQGEAQELALENLLREGFAQDSIDPVPKGESGADILQQISTNSGEICGQILWESKRTRRWNNAWLPKLRADQRRAGADLAVLVSKALPEGVQGFGERNGIWLCSPMLALPVAHLLRHSLQRAHHAQCALEDHQGKAEMVYQYLTGPRFRQRVEAMVEVFEGMQDDLVAEKKAIMRQWAKREMQIGRFIEAAVGMHGDLQGIAGQSIAAISSLEFQALSSPAERKTQE